MVTHEAHRSRAQRTPGIDPIAISDHRLRIQAPEQEEQIVSIAAHQRPGKQQRLATLARQYAHGLPLSRTIVLVLMAFIDYQQPEVTVRQVALDEFRRLIIALAKRKFRIGHGTLHPECLTITEHQVAVLIHQVDELVDIVFEHRAQKAFAKGREQTVCRFFADGRQLLECIEYDLAP